MGYRNFVENITSLPWAGFNPIDVCFTSIVSGSEFAESLICAQEVFPENNLLQRVVAGELWTDNLQFDHYTGRGHHVHFLYDFFLTKGFFPKVSQKIADAGVAYLEFVRGLTPEQRAMTVFSREQELPTIFAEILKAHPWDEIDMGFYAHYLDRHISWDSGEGGHGDLIKDFELDVSVLEEFYRRRLRFYEALK